MSGMTHDPQQRLPNEKIAIVGVGGTGSHVLDYISKLPVSEIHLYDADEFTNENTKRSPGSFRNLVWRRKKASFHRKRYRSAHSNIVAHDAFLDKENVNELADFSTVFLCIEECNIKKRIFEVCESNNVLLIVVGMDAFENEHSELTGSLIVTAGIPGNYGHLPKCVSTVDTEPNDDIDHNMQTIELNALNAALAVVKWKQVLGIYGHGRQWLDLHFSTQNNSIYKAYPVYESSHHTILF